MERQPLRPGDVGRREVLVAAGSLLVGGVAGCTRAQVKGGLSEPIDISGSSTVYPISTAMQELFADEHPDVDISVSRDGTSGGFENAFIPGKSDVNNASRPITEAEAQQCRDNGFEPIEFLVARDALTVVVNNDNDWVDCIGLDALRESWSPESPPETWADVNPDWPDEELRLFGPATTSGTFDYFTEHVVGEAGKIRSDFEETEEDDLIAQGVQDSRYAMGYLPFAYYTNNPEETTAIALEGDSGCVDPSLENANSGAYSLARPLFIYVNGDKLRQEEALQEFVRFYVENAHRKDLLADRIGYVPMSDQQVQENLAKLQEYTEP